VRYLAWFKRRRRARGDDALGAARSRGRCVHDRLAGGVEVSCVEWGTTPGPCGAGFGGWTRGLRRSCGRSTNAYGDGRTGESTKRNRGRETRCRSALSFMGSPARPRTPVSPLSWLFSPDPCCVFEDARDKFLGPGSYGQFSGVGTAARAQKRGHVHLCTDARNRWNSPG
jgi:hypothetical protein